MMTKKERLALALKIGTVQCFEKPRAAIAVPVDPGMLQAPQAFHEFARQENRMYIKELRKLGYTDIGFVFGIDDDHGVVSREELRLAAYHASCSVESVASTLRAGGFVCDL